MVYKEPFYPILSNKTTIYLKYNINAILKNLIIKSQLSRKIIGLSES